MKIRDSILITILSISIIPLIVLSTITLQEGDKRIVENQLLNMEIILDSLDAKIVSIMDLSKEEAKILSNTPAAPRIVRGYLSGGEMDPVSGISTVIERDRYSAYLKTVLEKIDTINKIDIVAKDSTVLISVEKVDDVVKREYLNVKMDDKYATIINEVSLLDKDSTHITSNFIKSDGSEPVIRFTNPIYPDDEFQGIFSMHVNPETTIFQSLRELDIEFFFISENGKVVRHFQGDKEFVFNENLIENFPNLDKDFFNLSSNSDQYDNNSYLAYKKIYFDRNDEDRNFTLILKREATLVPELSLTVYTILGITVAVVTLLGILLARRLADPITKIKLASQKIVQGEFDVEFESKGIEEFVQLSDSLKKMITFLKEATENEKKLRKAEKLTVIGKLASNIAHDFRNPLGAIKSSSVIIDKENKHNNKVMDRELNRINLSIKRMTHQVEDVLNYVRATPLSVSESTINKILNDSLDSIDVPNNVKINLPKNNIEIECDLDKLAIVFTNIILNAIQAIDDKAGTINIRVNECDNSIKIEVENSGPNIPDESLAKIFEPLYTTRFKGTGLGLSSCKNMIEQHKGTISAKSNPVVFTIQIPKKQ